jgi:malonyl-CoA O-methyltransferase
MNRLAVRRSFDRAATSYDSAATLQRRVCELLLAELPEALPRTILDAGCGTGYALDLLRARQPDANIIAVDFAPAMVVASGGGICADIEALPFPSSSFDLYWSSLSFQWCDAHQAIAEAARVLAPGGRLAVSSLGPGTLAELSDAFTGVDGHRHVLDFPPADALPTACAAAGLIDVRMVCQPVRLHHATLADLLGELKALGANQIGAARRPGLMGRRTWQTVEQRYEAHREPAGLPATFEVILCLASRPLTS